VRRFYLDHFRHHGRFYLAALCGLAVGGLLFGTDAQIRIALGGVTFFIAYLASTTWLARSLAAADLRKKAEIEDEGIAVIVLITLTAIVLSLVSLGRLLVSSGNELWLLVAIANVPLGWATFHTVMAFHYAHIFYSKSAEPGRKSKDAGGLEFPQTKEPRISDFVYYSFVVGMTMQVSDVSAASRQMRNTTLVHSVVAFFFNTVIIAFAVSVLASG
jgi:uncharacterized membrane protein